MRHETSSAPATGNTTSMTRTTATTTSRTATGDPARWRAVVERDPAADGVFVYAVRSTGIFCRPICASRLPGRDQVTFFATPAAAEESGFRACRRCRPLEPAAGVPLAERVRRACALLERADEELPMPTLAALGHAVGASPWHLQRAFRRLVGVTPAEYGRARRAERLKAGLAAGAPVTAAMYDAGFGSPSRLYERAAAELGMTPATYGRGGSGARVRWTVARSPLGLLFVAATERGVCSIKLGSAAATMAAELARELPRAEIARDDGALAAALAAVLARLEGAAPAPALPLDVRATAFQRRVWLELSRIPRGETRTYTEIAQAIGGPRSARAVARACATNPVPLAIPCHRVVPAAGGTGGYRFGSTRKATLLEREGAPAKAR